MSPIFNIAERCPCGCGKKYELGASMPPQRRETIGDKVEPAKPRVEYPTGAKRYSRGEASRVTKPGGDGYRISHGEGTPRLRADKEAMARIYQNLGLSCPDEDEDEEMKAFDDEAEGAVARVRARKTVKASAGLRGLVVGSQGCSLKVARK